MTPLSRFTMALSAPLSASLIAAVILSVGLASSSDARAAGHGEGCSAFSQCDAGLSCHPGVHKCYYSPRRVDEPCAAGYGCADGLTCEAGAHVCRAPGGVGDACHATRPCAADLACQPGVHKCYHSPRHKGEPCSAGFGCAPGLNCEAGSHVCRAPGAFGDACHATRPCGAGYSCQPGVHKCYHSPRQFGEPCSAGYSCDAGFECRAGVHKCAPKGLDFDADGVLCDAYYIESLSKGAKSAGVVFAYGAGGSVSALVAGSQESGTAYGPNGEFGCYTTVCVGGVSDLQASTFAAISEYNTWSDLAGSSVVYSGGASFPLFEIGVTYAWVNSLAQDWIGYTRAISFGVGVVPAQAGAMYCYTTVTDRSATMGDVKKAMSEAEKKAKAGKPPATVRPAATQIAGVTDWGPQNGKRYFFLADGTYARQAGDKVDAGYPSPTYPAWKGISEYAARQIVAILSWDGDGRDYVFLNDGTYLRYSRSLDRVDGDYPAPVASAWPGLGKYATRISAAFNRNDGKSYFFLNDGTYVRYNNGTKGGAEGVDPGYPKSTATSFKGLAGYDRRISGAVLGNDGKSVFFFLNDGNHLRYDFGTGVPAGYPKSTAGAFGFAN